MHDENARGSGGKHSKDGRGKK
uniref:Uncharacterized protein n=1 Tax=Arundo donax TaxID=35708 RepID=A0A0A8ZI29_ARUDO